MLSCVLSFQCSVLLVLPVIAHQHLIFLLLSLTLLAINPRLRYYRTYSTHYVHSDIDCQFFSTIISSQGLLAAPGPVPMSSSAPHAATVHIPQPRRHLEYSTGHRHSPSLEKKPTSNSTIPLPCSSSHTRGEVSVQTVVVVPRSAGSCIGQESIASHGSPLE